MVVEQGHRGPSAPTWPSAPNWPSNSFEISQMPTSGFFASSTGCMSPVRSQSLAPRCTCRGRCRGHAIRKEKQKKEQDLVDEEAELTGWPPPYPRSYEDDFRAHPTVVNGFVPPDHPTHEQELVCRRSMIYALNRAMKARDDRLLGQYVARLARHRIRTCMASCSRESVKWGFVRFRDAVRCLRNPNDND